MTTPDLELDTKDMPDPSSPQESLEERKRRGLLLLLTMLLLILCCVGYFFVRYLLQPKPLPELLPAPLGAAFNIPPTYKLSIPVDGPVGVAISPDGQRIYAVESGGERLIKIFDRDGKFIKSFAPPGTSSSNRKPAYIAVDAAGRVFVNDTYNNVVAIFDADGNFLDGMIDRDLTLSEFVTAQTGTALPQGTLFYFNNISKTVDYKLPGQGAKSVPGPQQSEWSPLGLRFDKNGSLMVTNIVSGKHGVLIYSAADLGALQNFNPQVREFGVEGKESGQLSFPNTAVVDSLGNFYISDGNNGRISVWTVDMQYKTFFAFGSTDDSVNLPRGLWMSDLDRLHVADAVGQYIRVYDISGSEPKFLFNFGEFGALEGEFNFPIDICMDASGRLYIADRENNRVQIWSY
jgi:DNA-binding beta-propeller fold protein YncE